MDIRITYGSANAPTELGAFDKALYEAGIANYNLIKLSSILPENSNVIVEKINWNEKEFGYKLYCVLSSQTEKEIGKEAWAGIGWVKCLDGSNKGLFVEHHGGSEKEVSDLIDGSLTSMKTYRPEEYGEINKKLMGLKCESQPVAALVCATYQTENWNV
jgi:arginine decarboxylase